jgi:PadR family transcriptional regulator, regulatory protein PadR
MELLQNCPCTGGTLDKLVQPAILAVLSRGPSHGYQIAEEISKMPNSCGGRPDTSGIYRFLKNMEKNGMVSSSWETPTTGHAKRLFEITADGEACLARWAETLEQYLATITALLEATRKAAKPKKTKNRSRTPR